MNAPTARNTSRQTPLYAPIATPSKLTAPLVVSALFKIVISGRHARIIRFAAIIMMRLKQVK